MPSGILFHKILLANDINFFDNLCKRLLTLMMVFAQVVEKSVTNNNNYCDANFCISHCFPEALATCHVLAVVFLIKCVVVALSSAF